MINRIKRRPFKLRLFGLGRIIFGSILLAWFFDLPPIFESYEMWSTILFAISFLIFVVLGVYRENTIIDQVFRNNIERDF